MTGNGARLKNAKECCKRLRHSFFSGTLSWEKLEKIPVSGVERIGVQKMESCEKLHVMRSEAGYPAGWLRQAAVLLVLCLLVAGADPCVSILFPKSYSESLEETEDLSTEITPGRSSDGESSVDPGIGGTDPVIVSAAAAETIPTPPAETDAAEGNEIGMAAAGTADSVMNGAAEIPVTDIPPAEESFPENTEPDIPAVVPPESGGDAAAGEGDGALADELPSGDEESGGAGESDIPAVTVGGFLVDETGMICGTADIEAAVSDGVLVLPAEGCSGIRAGAFADAPEGIIEVYIPAGITEIETGAFLGLDEVEWYEISPDNHTYYSEDGVLFSEDGICILAFPPGRTGIYPVPGGVSVFAADAFAGARIEKLITVECELIDTGNLPENIVII